MQSARKGNPLGQIFLAFLQGNLVTDPKSGCRRITVHDIYEHPVNDPWWADAVDKFKKIDKAKLPNGYVDGYEVETIGIDTSVYLDYLIDWFKRSGGELVQREVRDIQETFEFSSLVVNCTGLGSRELFKDQSVFPVRGQVVRVKPKGFTEGVFDEEGRNKVAYVIPRTKDVVLGGTVQPNDWDLSPRAADRAEILRKAKELNPALAQVEILSEGVGLRPARPYVRLEAERIGAKTVIHNYGHGGAGFTLSWGCAEEVLSEFS